MNIEYLEKHCSCDTQIFDSTLLRLNDTCTTYPFTYDPAPLPETYMYYIPPTFQQ